MELKEVIVSQYFASLEMLNKVIEACPPALWFDTKPENQFWHISYHVLFCTDMYLQESKERFVPWKKHRENYHFLGNLPQPPYAKPNIGEPYSKEELLEYFALCRQQVADKVAKMDFHAESGFFWLPINKLELQLYNIRHIQHHGGALIDRLRTHSNIGIDWVVKGHQSDLER